MKKNTRMKKNHLELFLGWLVAMGFRESWNHDGSVTLQAHFMNQPMLRNVTIWSDMRMNKGAIVMYQDFILRLKAKAIMLKVA